MQNQQIVKKYLRRFQDSNLDLSPVTLNNNTKIMMFVLKNIKTDLDKLTKSDIDELKL